jgi:hypothetical protein
MELDEFHVHQLGPRLVREREAVPRVLPAVAGDPEGPPNSAGREDDGAGGEDVEVAALAIVAEGPGDPLRVLQERDHRAFHVDIDSLVHSVILERADHLQAGAVADVGEAGIAVASEITLQDAPVLGPIEQRAPGLQLANALGSLLRVQLRHPPVVEVLSAAHGVGEVDLPRVAIVHVAQRRGDSPLGHDGVGFPEQRLAHQPHARLRAGRLDGRAQSRAPRADHQDVVLVRPVLRHQKILQSDQIPMESMRM